MSRMSVTFSNKNIEWMEKLVAKGEYQSKSELVNALVRQERLKAEELSELIAMLEIASKGPVSTKTTEQMRAEVLARRMPKSA